MKREANGERTLSSMPGGGLTGWLLDRLRLAHRPRPRLALLERIALAPRQSLALVEAEGRRFLVATSPEGAPAFYALDGEPKLPGSADARSRVDRVRPLTYPAVRLSADRPARVSW
jgi:flagellar biogenesis protein FliO